MAGPHPEPTFEHRLRAAAVALQSGRARTAEQALRALSAESPTDPHARWLLGVALLDLGKLEESIALLEGVLQSAPDLAPTRVDLARACRAAGRAAEAREQVRAVLAQHPHLALAWLAYGDVLVDLQQYDDARIAFERARQSDPERARIEAATQAMLDGDRKSAEGLFRQILQRDPGHAAALCGLAALSLAADVPADAERLLRHALRQSPHLPLAWRGLGPALLSLGRLTEAADAARYLRTIEPDNPQSWISTAAAATRLLRPEEALAAYERAVQLQPQEVRLRTSIGHVHKTLGRRAESEAAYHAALALDPRHAEAYWSLADLKNYRFSDAEVATMERVLADERRPPEGDAQLCFALGKAYEQRELYPRAFQYYARGNARRRRDQPFDIAAFEQRAARIRSFFNAAFFAARGGRALPGPGGPAPIFIVGLPRSGSTLVEQILASHSQVEGTMELPNILNLVRDLSGPVDARGAYPESLASLSPQQFAALGARYLEETSALRTGKLHFIDKLPNNFSHVGFIHAILPNAVVIDARREPMDCCFSIYKQHFAEGQTFSYDLADLGRYYRSYLETMAHWDSVLPGKVLQVKYEQLVRSPEQQIRRMLQHCGLPFEPGCLAFHETRRAVRTASAEQVRQPIYSSAIGHWRHFERELEPLRVALGDALQSLPASE